MISPVPHDCSGRALIQISSPDGRDHLVDEEVFARSPDGRYLARCGTWVLSAALVAPPGRPCALCYPQPVRPQRLVMATRPARINLRALLWMFRPAAARG